MSKRNRNRIDTATPSAAEPPSGTAPESETKEQAMTRLAKKRVPRAVQAIRIVGNLASYRPSAAAAAHIVSTLRAELDAVERSLLAGKTSAVAFELPPNE